MSLDEFVAVLRKTRRERKITQRQVGERLGVRQGTVANWERCYVRPADGVLRDWAALLAVDVPDGVQGWRTSPCGTQAGYQRHRYRGEATCQPCRTAATAARRERHQP